MRFGVRFHVGRGAVIIVAGCCATACTYDFDGAFAGAGGAGEGGGGGTGPGNPMSTGATTSTDATTSTSAGGGGSGPTDEQCDNGVDDDGSGQIDCADPTCLAAGYTCASAAPAGFEGPVALLRGPPDAQLVCGGAFPEELAAGGFGELDAEPPTCSTCGCDPVTGQTCTASLRWFADGSCGTELGSAVVSTSGCVDLGDVDVGSASATLATAQGGTCARTGGTLTSAPATFEEAATLCGASLGGGCDGGGACLLPPESPLEPKLCVFKNGAGTCNDAGPYSVLFDMHGGIDDQRGCADCACGAATGTCSGSTAIYRNNSSCNGAAVTLSHDDGCGAADQIKSYETSLAPSGGTCPASGGGPEGDAFPIEPITLCCLP